MAGVTFNRPGHKPGISPALLRPVPKLEEDTPRRVWENDVNFLDLGRPLPPGSVQPEELERIDPGLFFVWNMVQQRWEVWCSRESGLLPYFVIRCVTHPKTKYNWRHEVISACPGRPERSRRSTACPPSCKGKYEKPDSRLLKILFNGSMRVCEKARERALEELEREEERVEERAMRKMSNRVEDVVSDRLTQMLDIKSVGYTGNTFVAP